MSATVDTSRLGEAGTVVGHHPMGVSTGVFASSRGVWPALVAEACSVSSFAVELSALSGGELPGLIAYLRARPRLPFRYTSVHAPIKNLGEAIVIPQLGQLPLWVRTVVTHPDAIAELGPYRRLGTRLVLENMDDRKRTGRIADELEPFFEGLPEAGFCLDVAHAWSIDPTMEVARELLDRFRSRLRQVHLSSLSGGHHVPLRADDEELFADVLDRCRDVPWILEAMPPERWAAEMNETFAVAGTQPVGDQM
jgi:Xylose isomerase-like TIM barrel